MYLIYNLHIMCVLVCVCRCEIKIIDFGSSCYVTDHLTSYVQSRSYICTHTYIYLMYTYHIFNIHICMYIIYIMLRHGSLDVLCSRNNHGPIVFFKSCLGIYIYFIPVHIYVCILYICNTFNMHIFDYTYI
jgi:hypothetical protein